jgi:hypothetical protein
MAEEKVEVREINYRQVLPWTELFKGFQLAFDPKKLLMAAGGIVTMYLGWWLLSVGFYAARTEPKRSDYPKARYQSNTNVSDEEAQLRADRDFVRDHYKWELLNETAGPGGKLRTLPWFEDRGPNPYLWITGQEEPMTARSGWHFLRSEAKVLLEPLVKFLTPVIYLLKSDTGFWNNVYFTLVLVWTLATWALFGGAITRMAAVQLARKEKISIAEAFRFTRTRYLSFLSAPLFPLVFVVAIMIAQIIFGWFHMIPVVGDIIVDGVFWFLMLGAGLVMAVILVGLLGWPLMYATISTEGSDTFDALSRTYSYVYQAPWHYLWNSAVAIVYGAIVVFFFGFMGSLTVYLAKWGVSQSPGLVATNREPAYLFVYAPTSFGWRHLLMDRSPAAPTGAWDEAGYQMYYNELSWYNLAGAGLVAVWLGLAFLFIIGFGYSYFWSAGTIIYLLMRRHVDDTEIDEIYIEDDEAEDAYISPVVTSTPVPAPAAVGTTPLTMVEAPVLKTTAAPATPAVTKSASPDGGDAESATP